MNSTYDETGTMDDMESYFDFSQGDFQPSPVHARTPLGKLPDLTTAPIQQAHAQLPQDAQAMLHFQQQQQQQLQQQIALGQYSGPSHEYGRFKQQTGFPSGAIANVAALNEMSMQPSYSSGFTDFDFNSFTNDYDDFVDPSAIDAGVGSSSQVSSSQPARLFPGVHSQQAQQREAQKFATQSTPVLSSTMERHLSVDEQSASPAPTETDAKASREEDMDADERLLASEEGKKLTSKERRQLRNKVSARAFRSRRKEYISQLEGELATKSQESTDLRSRVRQLEEQNSQLSQLTKMLLNHPAFASVMQDMSSDPAILSSLKDTAVTQSQDASQSQQDIINASNTQQTFVGMTSIPEPTIDFDSLHLSNDHNQQVFAVTSLPEPVELFSSEMLSDKTASMPSLSLDPKSVLSTAATSAFPMTPTKTHDVSLPSLFAPDYAGTSSQPQESLPRGLSFDLSVKPIAYELVTVSLESEEELEQQLEQLLAPADALLSRLSSWTAHLH